MNETKTALVTGANGFVGSHLVDLLLKENYKVKCLVRKSSNLRWLEGKNVEIITSGLFDKEGLVRAFEGVDYIYHVAGVIKSKKPEGYYKGNVEATQNILEAALNYKDKIKRILIVSSQTAAGPSPAFELIDETHPCAPITNYGKSKRAEEELVQTYFDKLPITICRPPAVYGERDTEIFIFFNSYWKGVTTTIGFGKKEGQKKLSLIHAIDLVRGFYLAATNPNSKGQTYFISSEEVYTWERIIAVTSKVMNKKAIVFKVPHCIVYTIAAVAQLISVFQKQAATLNIEKARDITQSSWTCSTEKAVKELGYKQNISLEQGIEETIAWYKKEGWLR
jgi:dihydroflavonol-4-reductase